MSRLPPAAKTHVNIDGLIFGDDFADSYFSRDNGLEESRTVFLKGCGLPEAWANRTGFVIGELGFGTGLNVLATWALWNASRPPNGILHIVSVEGFLLDGVDAQAAHARWPELKPLSDQLIAKWPTRAYGAQRIWFPDDGVCITFLIGPCERALERMDFQADCWFLDGFAPARNPDMWSLGVFTQIARLSGQGARIATYSVAGAVRAGLAQVGFNVTRVAGFGSKRQRLEGRFSGEVRAAVVRPKTAIVIGGGIGGACVGAALTKRGIQIDLFDVDPCGATKASANPVALIMPRLDRGDTSEAQFFRASYLMALENYAAMPQGFEQTGVNEVAADQQSLERLTDLYLDPPFPPCHLARGDDQSLRHVQGGLVHPDLVLKQLTEGVTRHPIGVARLEWHEGIWRAFNEMGEVLAAADMCVIANGPAAGQFCDLNLSLRGRAGQLSWARIKGLLPQQPFSGGAYAAPFNGRLVFGATYGPSDLDARPSPVSLAAHIQNRDALARIQPDLASTIDMDTASGRCAIRAATPDQLPIAGAIEKEGPGKYIVSGLGSRGFTTAFLCAEIVASLACGEPSPVEAKIALALAPDRFEKRAIRRGVV